MSKQDFTKPAVNDKSGHCVACGRDNRGYPGEPCSDECPMYWEEIGIEHPDYPAVPSDEDGACAYCGEPTVQGDCDDPQCEANHA